MNFLAWYNVTTKLLDFWFTSQGDSGISYNDLRVCELLSGGAIWVKADRPRIGNLLVMRVR